MTKALIVYGTQYGVTVSTSEDIADVIHQEGFDVNLVNLKDQKLRI